MSRTETVFYRFIDRRPWRRLIIGAGLIGYFAISLTFLTVGVLLMPLRWVRAASANHRHGDTLPRPHDIAVIR